MQNHCCVTAGEITGGISYPADNRTEHLPGLKVESKQQACLCTAFSFAIQSLSSVVFLILWRQLTILLCICFTHSSPITPASTEMMPRGCAGCGQVRNPSSLEVAGVSPVLRVSAATAPVSMTPGGIKSFPCPCSARVDRAAQNC